MKISIKHLLFVFLLALLSSGKAYSQCYLNTGEGSNFSLELGAGVLFPSSPSANDISFGDASKFELGLRYLPKRSNLGLRAYYAYASLSDTKQLLDPTTENMLTQSGSLKIHRFEVQGIYMLDELLNLKSSAFELESYLGLGFAFGKGEATVSNNMLSSSLGLRPRYQLSPKLHLYLDASYTFLYNQQLDYTGHSLNAKKGNMGSMAQLSIGLSYRL